MNKNAAAGYRMHHCQCHHQPSPLTKGLEEEIYTGDKQGTVHGLSGALCDRFPGHYDTEPDARNVEYRSAVHRCYAALASDILERRHRLRRDLASLGNYTLVPGATLSLADPDIFMISRPDNAYYQWIRDRYGSRVVTASVHINVGISDVPTLLRVWRTARLDAWMFLALSAASPFLGGQTTGLHSSRWQRFPQTPKLIPWLPDHQTFRRWVSDRLADGQMQSHRHLWTAVRPNGPASPGVLDRIELRICDHIWEPQLLLAITAFFEALVLEIMVDDREPPGDEQQRQQWCSANETAAATHSLDAQAYDWRSGRMASARTIIAQRLESLCPLARTHGFAPYLEPLEQTLDKGSTGQQWLALHHRGLAIADILGHYSAIMVEREQLLAQLIAQGAQSPCAKQCKA